MSNKERNEEFFIIQPLVKALRKIEEMSYWLQTANKDSDLSWLVDQINDMANESLDDYFNSDYHKKLKEKE